MSYAQVFGVRLSSNRTKGNQSVMITQNHSEPLSTSETSGLPSLHRGEVVGQDFAEETQTLKHAPKRENMRGKSEYRSKEVHDP